MKQKRKVICFADKCVCVEEIRQAKEFDDKERGYVLMFYQIYNIHLLNGEAIQASEPYDLPTNKGLVGMFKRMEENDILTVNDLLLGSAYIPRKSILYLATGDVVEGKAWR